MGSQPPEINIHDRASCEIHLCHGIVVSYECQHALAGQTTRTCHEGYMHTRICHWKFTFTEDPRTWQATFMIGKTVVSRKLITLTVLRCELRKFDCVPGCPAGRPTKDTSCCLRFVCSACLGHTHLLAYAPECLSLPAAVSSCPWACAAAKGQGSAAAAFLCVVLATGFRPRASPGDSRAELSAFKPGGQVLGLLSRQFLALQFSFQAGGFPAQLLHELVSAWCRTKETAELLRDNRARAGELMLQLGDFTCRQKHYTATRHVKS